MKIKYEERYIITDIVAVPIVRSNLKSSMYREATGDGWGTVYTEGIELICDCDSSSTLINKDGEQCCIYPYEELKPKEWFKQAECKAIICTNGSTEDYWEAEKGLIQIFVTYDKNGFIDTWRLADWTEKPYEDEIQINFEDLPDKDPYSN